jgi:hypothetical protein
MRRCDPQGHTLTDISRISQQTNCLPMHLQTKPTPTRTADVNATEGGTNGADVSVSPYPYGISQRLSTKSNTGCTLPQSSASCLTMIARQAQGMRAGEVIAKFTENAYFMRVDNRVAQVPPVRTRQPDNKATHHSPVDNERNRTRG